MKRSISLYDFCFTDESFATFTTQFQKHLSRRKNSDCLWWSHANSKGYGTFKFSCICFLAHRVSYELTNGRIPQGLVIDHLCRNKRCCNISHLEAVSFQENLYRNHHKFELRIPIFLDSIAA